MSAHCLAAALLIKYTKIKHKTIYEDKFSMKTRTQLPHPIVNDYVLCLLSLLWVAELYFLDVGA